MLNCRCTLLRSDKPSKYLWVFNNLPGDESNCFRKIGVTIMKTKYLMCQENNNIEIFYEIFCKDRKTFILVFG